MPTVALFNQQGEKLEDIQLNAAVFGVEPHQQAMFDAIVMQRASLRQGTHSVKNRSAVAGGGRKPWKQKGTGRARQGSIRAAQWRGGGVVFGPIPRSYSVDMNKKVYRLALKSVLATKVNEGKFIVVDALSFEKPQTKAMINMLSAFNVDRKPLLITAELDVNVALSARNIPNAQTLTVNSVSVLEIANANTVIITLDAVKQLEEVLA
ncbi:MAG: 50S ribosomal protein L4 [Culicoidibacterales bacterium]